jgi:hypothetical protein
MPLTFYSSGKGNLVHYLVGRNYYLEYPVLKPEYLGVPILHCSRVKECISRVITKLHFVLLFDAVIFYAQISFVLQKISLSIHHVLYIM